MAEFSSHGPGTFSWVELATTDREAGVGFYRALFGWDYTELDVPGQQPGAGMMKMPDNMPASVNR